jgi:hypothetical protein
MKLPLPVEWTVALLIFIGVTLFSVATQPAFTHNQGQGYDGLFYYSMAEQFVANQTTVIAPGPFSARIGVPWLAAKLFPENLIFGFYVINIAFGVIVMMALVIWLRLHIVHSGVRVAIYGMYCLHYIGIIRSTRYLPVTIDVPSMAILMIGLLMISAFIKDRQIMWILGLTFISFLGGLIRESSLIIPLTLLVAIYYRKIGFKRVYFLPIVAGGIGFFVADFIGVQSNAYSFILIAIYWLYDKSPLRYLQGILVAFGPVLVFLIIHRKNLKLFLDEHPELTFFVMIFGVLAWVGGSDTERIMYWAAPVVYVLIGRAIQPTLPLSRWLIILIVPLQLISERVFWVFPQNYTEDRPFFIPFLTIVSNQAHYDQLLSTYVNETISFIYLIEYGVVLFLLYVLMRGRAIRRGSG